MVKIVPDSDKNLYAQVNRRRVAVKDHIVGVLKAYSETEMI